MRYELSYLIFIIYIYYCYWQYPSQWGSVSNTKNIKFSITNSVIYSIIATTNSYIGNRTNGRPADTCGVLIQNMTKSNFNIYKAVMHSEQYNSGNANQNFSGYYHSIGK